MKKLLWILISVSINLNFNFIINTNMSFLTNYPITTISSIYGSPAERTGHFGVKYRGINTVKCPFDYTIYQMIIMDIKPDLIIEIGTYKGGSSLYYSDLLNLIGRGGVIHTIDIIDYVDSDLVKENPNIKRFFGGYQNYDLQLLEGFETILVIEDGSHQYDDVIGAFVKFSPYVSKSSYYIVEDGVISYLELSDSFSGGPLKAVNDIMIENKNFIIDRSYCDFFGYNATFNPNGYLKRI